MDKKKTKKSLRKSDAKRHIFQTAWMLLTNGYLHGFLTGRIYKGKLKQLCVPGLNCYSCAGALGSCPIGAMQAVIGRRGKWFSFYVFGFLMMIGSVLGRFVCGWLCPFGLIQDLLFKIPFPKKIKRLPKEDKLVKAKYFVLAIFVVILPLFLVDSLQNGAPAFCKWICPVGTLEGGIPSVLSDSDLSQQAGWLFVWKVFLLVVVLFAGVVIFRPFCKYICPLGAIYSLFNKVSIYRYRVDSEKCIGCNKCAKICKMNVDPVKDANHPECIRCGKCKSVCPVKAIDSGFFKYEAKPSKEQKKSDDESTE